MNLVIDIGNTKTKIGVFDENKLIYVEKHFGFSLAKITELVNKYPLIQRSIASTVSYSIESLKNCLRKSLGIEMITFNHRTKLPIINKYLTPETLGLDRLAGAIGANHLFPNQNCLIIDAGTCLKYDIIDSTNSFIGGNISLGLKMRYKAMHHFTQKLPLIKVDSENIIWIGNSTKEALMAGAETGMMLEITGFVNEFEKTLRNLNIFLTGGDSKKISLFLKREIFLNHNLVLIGLNKILVYNALK